MHRLDQLHGRVSGQGSSDEKGSPQLLAHNFGHRSDCWPGRTTNQDIPIMDWNLRFLFSADKEEEKCICMPTSWTIVLGMGAISVLVWAGVMAQAGFESTGIRPGSFAAWLQRRARKSELRGVVSMLQQWGTNGFPENLKLLVAISATALATFLLCRGTYGRVE
ncbi:uncharacterized protein LOC142575731 isoform X2 [Dermacentor variabilis]|uniref:uncharacterized protein LOC142575731 isoform X2 n=1 Tax=Dermacentor variabilis TaxID=34621 RepID=UPI003F5C2494